MLAGHPQDATTEQLGRHIELSCLLPLLRPGMKRQEVLDLVGEPGPDGRYYTHIYKRLIEYDAQDEVIVSYADLYHRAAQHFGDPNEVRALQELVALSLDGPLPVDLHWRPDTSCLAALRRLGDPVGRGQARAVLAEGGLPTLVVPPEYTEALKEYADGTDARPLTLGLEVSRLGDTAHRFCFTLRNTGAAPLDLWVAPNLFSLHVTRPDGAPVHSTAVLKRFVGRFESCGQTISLEPGQAWVFATTELTAIEGGPRPSEWALVPQFEAGVVHVTGSYLGVDRFLRMSLAGVWCGSVVSDAVELKIEGR